MINIIKKYIKEDKVYSQCTGREKAQIEFAINMVETELNDLRDKVALNKKLLERIKRLEEQLYD